jgi:hypothetical protein
MKERKRLVKNDSLLDVGVLSRRICRYVLALTAKREKALRIREKKSRKKEPPYETTTGRIRRKNDEEEKKKNRGFAVDCRG